MTDTEELQEMLDIRGKRYETRKIRGYNARSTVYDVYEPPIGKRITVVASEYFDRDRDRTDYEIRVRGATPGQIIEVTLGCCECEIEHRRDGWYCTGCDRMVGSTDPRDALFVCGNAVEEWSYCPWCGRKVKR